MFSDALHLNSLEAAFAGSGWALGGFILNVAAALLVVAVVVRVSVVVPMPAVV